MKNQAQIAGKYAQALFEVASEKGLIEEYKASMTKITEQLSVDDFQVLQHSPMASQISFKEMVKTSFANVITDKILQSFFFMLIDNGRLGLLPKIISDFTKKIDQKDGILRGEVRTSRELKDTEMQKLTAAVEENLKQKVNLKFNVDTNLIGGFEINVDGYQFVDSIRGHLNKLNEVVRRSAN